MLKECTALVNAVEDRTILEILGSPDDLKFHSSMTLFGAVSPDPEFAASISRFTEECLTKRPPSCWRLKLDGLLPGKLSDLRRQIAKSPCEAREGYEYDMHRAGTWRGSESFVF
jgi:hypothetical protein